MKLPFNLGKFRKVYWKYVILIGGLIELIIYFLSNKISCLYAGLILLGFFVLIILVEKIAFRKK